MKKRAILLTGMIGWYFSLILFETFKWKDSHPLFPKFPLFGFIPYNYFWLVFWGLATLISFTLIFTGIKNIVKVNNYINKENIKEI